MTQFINRW
jgi:heme/copper-type cytochrome/quinol oxidase subunit 1